MQADVLILYHHPAGLEPVGDIERLVVMRRGRLQPRPQILFLAILGKADAIHRADVDAGIAFDTGGRGKYGLDIAIQAALGFAECELDVIAEFDLGADVPEPDHFFAVRHLVALVPRDIVFITPLLGPQLPRWKLPLGPPDR